MKGHFEALTNKIAGGIVGGMSLFKTSPVKITWCFKILAKLL